MNNNEKPKMKCVEVKKIKDTALMVNTIYNNFLYLVEYPDLMHTRDEINKVLNSNGCMNLLVFYNNKLIGYLIGNFRTLQDSRYVFYISYFYISQEYRNRGIGSKLMNLLPAIVFKGLLVVISTWKSVWFIYPVRSLIHLSG